VELAEHGDIAYIGFEYLGEHTIVLAQQARLADPDAGDDPLLGASRMGAVLGEGLRAARRPHHHQHGRG
jgi:hypothetical protein